MMNHLEQLIAEWLEFRGYFVRRNVKVGKLAHGGHEGELDIVAYHPINNHLIHIEPSNDAQVCNFCNSPLMLALTVTKNINVRISGLAISLVERIKKNVVGGIHLEKAG